MKKFLSFVALAASCVFAVGCSTANAEEKTKTNHINEDITVKSGYYTCAEDDSYIHVDGNKIELCNFDYEADAERSWNETM